MCQNTSCPLRGDCYRYLAEPSPVWQTMASFAPGEDGVCRYQWKITDGRRVRRLQEADAQNTGR